MQDWWTLANLVAWNTGALVLGGRAGGRGCRKCVACMAQDGHGVPNKGATRCQSSYWKEPTSALTPHLCLVVMCVSAPRCPSAAFSPEASLNQKRLHALDFKGWSCRSCGLKKKKKTDKNSVFCLCFSSFSSKPPSSLSTPSYNGGKWSKGLQGGRDCEARHGEGLLLCNKIQQKKRNMQSEGEL